MQKNEIAEIVKRARNKDSEAFIHLMQLHMQSMYRVALAILMNDEDVADAIQETILIVWEKIESLKETRYFKTWMIRILINNCYDIRKKSLPIVELEEWKEPVSEDSYNLEWKEALASLDKKYSIVLTLFYSEGYSVREISHMLRIPTSTVRTRLQRGRERLSFYYQDAQMDTGYNKSTRKEGSI